MKNIEQLLNKENWIKYLELADKGGITNHGIAQDIVKEIEQAINYSRCCETLKDKEAISFGRYCATRGYHKFEGVWVNRQKFPRDIEWIKKQYRKDIFDL